MRLSALLALPLLLCGLTASAPPPPPKPPSSSQTGNKNDLVVPALEGAGVVSSVSAASLITYYWMNYKRPPKIVRLHGEWLENQRDVKGVKYEKLKDGRWGISVVVKGESSLERLRQLLMKLNPEANGFEVHLDQVHL
jgi:hypothetical protein